MAEPSVIAILTSPLPGGAPVTSLPVGAPRGGTLADPVAAGEQLIVGYGQAASQVATVAAPGAPAGSISIPVNSFTPNQTYPVLTKLLTASKAFGGALVTNVQLGYAGRPYIAPVLTAVAGATSFHTGSVSVGYTYVTAAGESLISRIGTVSITAGQAIQVTGFGYLPVLATSLKFYFTAVPAGDTTGFSQAAAVTAGAISTFNLTTQGNAAAAPGASTADAATALPGTALSGRQRVRVSVPYSQPGTVYIGASAALGPGPPSAAGAQGTPVIPGGVADFWPGGAPLYAATLTDGLVVQVEEYA